MALAVLGADEDVAEEANEVGELDAAALNEEVLVDVTEDVAESEDAIDELDGGKDAAELLNTLVLESVILADTLLWKVVL